MGKLGGVRRFPVAASQFSVAADVGRTSLHVRGDDLRQQLCVGREPRLRSAAVLRSPNSNDAHHVRLVVDVIETFERLPSVNS